MKRILLLTAIAVSALTACQKAETTITFNLTDLPEGTVVTIGKNHTNIIEDVTTQTTDRTFCYTYTCDTISEFDLYYVMAIKGSLRSMRPVFIKENCNSTVTGSGIFAENWTIESENPRQQFYDRWNDATKDLRIEYNKIRAELDNPSREKVEKFNEAQSKLREAEWAFIESTPIDEYWLEAFADATDIINRKGTDWPKYPRMTEIYKRLSDADKATPAGKQITKNLFGGEKAAE